MNDLSQTPASAPQLRTLLLTDLCDSTSLVERLGDNAAADLFQAHDRLVLELQQRWRGRLIDRSDGLLLLFERPIDGLGFALDYQQGLREIGRERQQTLAARSGLHVGEVLTWRNSDEAVRVGAKPLEVEGLAKPMAGRLMAMARPGQILLSAVAEPLAYRAARELGERGQHLSWKSHGRWAFKGVPGTQEIFEVGEPGVAPLRMPPSSAKAWRAIPLWRRPAALATEVALIAGLGVAGWFVTRPQPAIAFGERDWVVVGDLRNLTGDKLLDDSLEQAFRISLEQSRYVNVLSDLKARDTLARMRRAPNTVLDRNVASEIALRDGARAVILPTVSEVGGRVRVSAEVIDPHTQTTVYAESADGKGVESALGSVDQVAAGLRGRLGEALQSLQSNSRPLPDVTTARLDALRAYALAQKSYSQGQYAEAATLFEQATRIDGGFALAWLGLARSAMAQWDYRTAVPALRRAQQFRARLAPREAMYLDGWAAQFDAPGDTLKHWTMMARLYPDFFPALGNSAIRLVALNRYTDALRYARQAQAPQNETIGNAYEQAGRALLGLERYSQADAAFSQAIAHGKAASWRRRADIAAARRDFANASRLLSKAPANEPDAWLERVSFEIDQGRWIAARAQADAALVQSGSGASQRRRAFMLQAALAEWMSGARGAARRLVADVIAESLPVVDTQLAVESAEEMQIAMAAALLAERFGDHAHGERVIAALSKAPLLRTMPELAEQMIALQADAERIRGNSARSLELIAGLGHEPRRFQTRRARLDALAANGQTEAALREARLLAGNRGLAYSELGGLQCLQALNVADATLALRKEARVLERAGRPQEAAETRALYSQRWRSAPAAELL